ncbi:hypothetical protein ABH991_000278 [Bradyrhizobium ottawaense]|uniref:GNAT family N-acetyltransferase n=1 Tax=Bradyrhizobium ottawaense TaxID=931866 RepID=A0ABV4FSR0_9BRAD|nr:hypothetical protein SG09_01310 [Bradyrhizobium ottawaense]GMO11219.1 hypothetical protein BwSH20_76950 [Bradyrhizobium ottawaense]GMO22960.1 hypothetical protein BwSF21_18720 [Bradyrhizobium ottawaense]GMO24025.1 hypothetical protein BwSF12_18230 [Bradyrhizobium ottawaense]GMO38793.1 hypothetical protein BwSH14_48000 [Bradyrhizobium ottawaense]
MILPDGYSDVPTGKIAAVVTHLEMTAPPARRDDPPGVWVLRKVDAPALDWYRDLHRRVGEEWLWFSRVRMNDTELAAIIHAAGVEVYALAVDGRDEGLLELDFREAGQCELAYFGVTAPLIGTGAASFLMNRALDLALVARRPPPLGPHLHARSPIRRRLLPALRLPPVPPPDRDRRRSAPRRHRAARRGEACACYRVAREQCSSDERLVRRRISL